jgi:hypothetical protein
VVPTALDAAVRLAPVARRLQPAAVVRVAPPRLVRASWLKVSL